MSTQELPTVDAPLTTQDLRALRRNMTVLRMLTTINNPTIIYDGLVAEMPHPVYTPYKDLGIATMPKRMRSKTAAFTARVVKAIEAGEDPSTVVWSSSRETGPDIES